MRLTPVQSVEAFHLIFLRVLESIADRSAYVVKGGVNLRAWFGSQRYSEGLDIDVVRGEVFEIQDRVNRTLTAPALRKLMTSLGLEITRTSVPKQTETTQRWKLGLEASGVGVELHTKIEFSRRGIDDDYSLEPVLQEIVRPYGIPSPTANHYSLGSAIRQKIGALLERSNPQARDTWDLDHLFRVATSVAVRLPGIHAARLQEAVDRVLDTSFDEFQAQVAPFLETEIQDLYRTRDAWERIQEHVSGRIESMIGQ